MTRGMETRRTWGDSFLSEGDEAVTRTTREITVENGLTGEERRLKEQEEWMQEITNSRVIDCWGEEKRGALAECEGSVGTRGARTPAIGSR